VSVDAFVQLPELRALSGYTRKGDVCRWLDGEGVVYKLNRKGEPFCTVEAFNGRRLARGRPRRENAPNRAARRKNDETAAPRPPERTVSVFRPAGRRP
jgi:hypothetical protein